ncbi:sororin [Brachyistius frenatus]|uniref:sororin n=1 Tax=Brachyistius frenatus TaxID=100188 RepID=UPI0037E7D4D8
MTESDNLSGPRRRRSPRLSSPRAAVESDNKMAFVAVKRSIAVRKIAPRKTVAPSEHNKENTPKQEKPKVSTPGTVQGGGGSSSAKKKKKKKKEKEKEKAVLPSPILPSTPPPPSQPQRPAEHPEDAVWSQKVRRSYSRLGDKSLSSPDSRDNFFGFEKMNTPEVGGRRGGKSQTNLEVSGSLFGLNSFASLLEADDGASAFPEPDPNIPGVAVAKERRRRRRKVQQMDTTELNALAAKMNAEFEEAEEFELIVE